MARKSRKQTAAPMPAPSLYVHVALYIRLSVEDNKKRGCSVENQKLVLNDFLSDKPDFVVYDTYIDNGATGTNFHRPGFQQMLSDIEAGHIIAKCTHEPIISHELFNAVQEYRKQICEESKATPKRPYTPNIFKGKVFCTDCGRSLHRQRAERRKGPDTYWFHCLTNSRVEKDSCKGAMIQEKELISTVTDILEKELTVALGMSLPLFQLEARQKQEKDKLKIQMSAKRQEIEKTRRLIRGLYENFVQGILTNDEYFELKADYEHAINALSGEIEVFEKSMDSLDNQLARYRAMEKDAKTLAQDHVLTAELIERLIERIEIDHERNIHVTFRFKNEFQGKAVEPCATM